MTTLVEERTQAVTVADLLLRAADLLEEFGWQQGHVGSREAGAMCAVGALYEAQFDFARDGGDVFRAACSIEGVPDEAAGVWPLAKWNDEPGRTKAEVVARLREAAKVAS